MTIYILDQEPKLCAQMLDDGALDKMIKSVAQVLCSAHINCDESSCDNHEINGKTIPYLANYFADDKKSWQDWTSECRANYLWMVELGMACCDERIYREVSKFGHVDTMYQPAIEFARDNVPELPKGDKRFLSLMGGEIWINTSQLPTPLGYPKNHDLPGGIIEGYRSYYKAKISCKKCKGTGFIDNITLVGAYETDCDNCSSGVVTKWTRRERPEFLS